MEIIIIAILGAIIGTIIAIIICNAKAASSKGLIKAEKFKAIRTK